MVTDSRLYAPAKSDAERTKAVAAAALRAARAGDFLIGRSVHSEAEAIAAEAAGGCDYLIFGTVYESRSKPAGHPVAGVDALARVCAAVRLPVLAIGGITIERIPEVAAAGAAGVAAIGLFGHGTEAELAAIVGRLRDAFDQP
jgi:thiamine-phosphate diphosphorylase